MPKRLYRSKRERVFAGVCGGIAEYLDVDPTLIRLAWFIFILMAGTGILAYFVAMIIIPENPKEKAPKRKEPTKEEYEVKNYDDERKGALIGGMILLLIGFFFLANNFGLMVWMDWGVFWPVILIVIGLMIIIGGSVRKW